MSSRTDQGTTSEPGAPLTALTGEEIILRDTARRFARERVAPRVRQMDAEQKLDPEILNDLFALGFMGIEVPPELDGAGASFFSSILAIEEISKVDPGVAVMVDVQNTLAIHALMNWGSSSQKSLYLPRLCADTVGSYALSEAGSGSDAFAMAARATREGDDYVLDGRKQWISNAAEAGLFVVFANAEPALGYKGITAFLVDRETPGLSIGHKEDKLGIRASSTCEVVLDHCRVPAGKVLGEPGQGYRIAIETLDNGRIGIAAQMLGLAEGAWSLAVEYSRERRQFGKTLSEFQAVAFALAEMKVQIEAARLLVYNAARAGRAGEDLVRDAAIAKYFCSAVAEDVASRSLEVFGGYGFVKDSPIEKFYRDAKIGKIYEGTSNMQLETISRKIFGR